MGGPYLNWLVEAAENATSSPWLMYINADVMLPQGFVEGVMPHLEGGKAAVGMRLDCPGEERTNCKMHAPTGKDYFLYPRGAYGARPSKTIPPYVIGKFEWDSFMMKQVKRRAVDVTPVF